MLLRTLAVLGAFALTSCATLANGQSAEATSQEAAEEEKPNILILFFDDLRFDSFSYRGGPVPTPNIDALAAESTRFDMAITTTGLCSPSRAALFTGRWGHRTGLDDNLGLWTSRLNDMNPEEGGFLRDAADSGYYVGYVGKWHLGERGPQIRGAEFAKLDAEVTAGIKPYTPYAGLEIIRGYNSGARDAGGEKHQYYQTTAGGYEDTPAAEKVHDGQELIRNAARRGEPFLGVVSFQQPHPPYRVPEPYASMFDPAEIALPSNFGAARKNKPLAQEYAYWPWHDVGHMTETDWRESRAKYYGAVAMIDRAVGDLIRTAKEEGIYDDLHIVFLGDQGSMIGEHGLYDKAAYAYDELMRIPLLMRDPDAKPGVVNRHVSLIDIPATLFDWMKLTPSKPIDGRSLAGVIDGSSALTGPDDALYAFEWYNGAWFGLRAIRTPEHKYVWNPGDSRDELYDLVTDPGEVTNLISSREHADVVRQLRGRLLDRLEAIEDPSAKKLQSFIERTYK
ncbi:sulfatase-like hydrolase/transferase [Erythrobacter sp. F6033]|uniref:sulfatase-like hydrolase/transferase n=1 Tax=Erythrobacter sp. F6033 TaxID=2926401 RepID=UPI001FF2CB82|nr:sulfatase-like hydrolase/transferase [Erythrobacter sp. F6033]MCK0129289.1 sulfatase-like hydrolase/transferase [Erythrobacter sp. F6033]